MRRLTLQPTRIERGLFSDAYDELSSELSANGWTIIEPLREYEERSAGRGPVWDGISLAIHLSEEVGHDALGVIVGIVMMKVYDNARLPVHVAGHRLRSRPSNRDARRRATHS